MSDFEDFLHRALDDRAGGVRTAPDEGDLRRRIHSAQRASARRQRRALAAALVVVAGSAGGVLGAIATRPAGVTADGVGDQVTTTQVTPQGGSSATVTNPRPAVPATSLTSVVHRAALAGVTVEWVLSRLTQPIEVVPGSGQPATCSKAAIVSLTIATSTPVAGGSAVVGMPAVQSQGLAVVSSGTFGSSEPAPASAGGSSGWWAVVEAGSAATEVAVQFPSGAVVRTPVSAGGVAVVASLAPAGENLSGLSQYASAVAEGGTQAMGSLEFLVGGGPVVVDAASAASSATALASCALSSAVGAGAAQLSRPTGPPAPLVAAGDVVAAYAQAYDVDPLLGLTWNFAAVDLGTSLGCPVESLPSTTSGSRTDGLSAPAVAVQAVTFNSPVSAIVVYQRGSGILETGTAQLVDGTWKVGKASYCADMQTPAS